MRRPGGPDVTAPPEWEQALASVTLTGPNGSTTLGREGDTAAALLRDPATGRVRGILHDGADSSLAQVAATAGRLSSSPGLGLDVQVSRGNVDVGLRSSSNPGLVNGCGPWQDSADVRWKSGRRDTSLRRP